MLIQDSSCFTDLWPKYWQRWCCFYFRHRHEIIICASLPRSLACSLACTPVCLSFLLSTPSVSHYGCNLPYSFDNTSSSKPIYILILILTSLQLLDLNTQPCTAFLGINWSILLPLTQLLLTYLVQSLWKRLSLDAATAFLINHLPCIVWAHSFFSVHWTLYIISCKN